MIHNSSLLHGRNCNCYCLMCLQAPLIEGAYKVHVDMGGYQRVYCQSLNTDIGYQSIGIISRK